MAPSGLGLSQHPYAMPHAEQPGAQLQLLALACLWLASKYEEANVPRAASFLQVRARAGLSEGGVQAAYQLPAGGPAAWTCHHQLHHMVHMLLSPLSHASSLNASAPTPPNPRPRVPPQPAPAPQILMSSGGNPATSPPSPALHEAFLSAEASLLAALGYSLGLPTGKTFLRRTLYRAPADSQVGPAGVPRVWMGRRGCWLCALGGTFHEGTSQVVRAC